MPCRQGKLKEFTVSYSRVAVNEAFPWYNGDNSDAQV